MKKGFDLDETIYDLVTPLDNWIKKNKRNKIDTSYYDLSKRYSETENIIVEWLNEFQGSGGYRNLKIYKDAKKVLSKLLEPEDYFITNRGFNEELKKETSQKVKEDFPTVNIEKQLIISHEKGSLSRKLSLDLFFEDCLENAKYIIEKSNAHVILFNKTYNREMTPKRTTRVDNWAELIPFSEIYSKIKKYSFPKKITISGFPGAGKTNSGELLSKLLGYEFLSMGELRRDFAQKNYNTDIQGLNEMRKTSSEVDTKFDNYQKKYGEKNNNFLVEGRLGYHFIPDSLKIFLYVDGAKGAERLLKQKRKDEAPAKSIEEQIKINDERIVSDILTYKKQYNQDCYNEKNFDAVIDTTNLSEIETVVKLVEIIKN